MSFEQMFERLWLQIKGMRKMFLVPFIGYYALMPLVVWVMYQNTDFELTDIVSDVCYLFVPFLSTWWCFMIHKEYLEGDGREILLLGRGILSSTIAFWGMNLICFSTLPLLVKDDSMSSISNLVFQLMIISFFICGLAYCINFYTQSITISMLVVLFYTVFSNYTFHNDTLYEICTPFQLIMLEYVDIFSTEYWKFVVAGLIFWILGIYKSKRIA